MEAAGCAPIAPMPPGLSVVPMAVTPAVMLFMAPAEPPGMPATAPGLSPAPGPGLREGHVERSRGHVAHCAHGVHGHVGVHGIHGAQT